VTSWPSDYRQAWTLRSSVERTGVGLHSGAVSRVRLGPYAREAEALKVLSQIRTAGYPNARLIKP